jgi:hypothetical protein
MLSSACGNLPLVDVVAQTRTWNLLIDLIAQSGRYPSNANSLTGFVVEERCTTGSPAYVPQSRDYGEAGVAIDRFTGQVLDKQIEVVSE